MDGRRRNRMLRVAIALGVTVATTGLIGYGGLAAWQSYTENAGNSVAAGSLTHANTVTNTCTSVNSTALLNEAGNVCDTIITVTGVAPASPATLATGAVKIDNSGSLSSSFSVSEPAAPTGNLCPDLVLTMTDKNGTTVWSGAASVTIPPTSLNNNAATPSTLWTGGDATHNGTGATGNTFTFAITKGTTFNTDSSDQGQSCAFAILFTQSA